MLPAPAGFVCVGAARSVPPDGNLARQGLASRPVSAFARRPVLLVAGLTGLVLLLVSGRDGYHRDELYFLTAGHHPAWGYPDQPPLVPLLARGLALLAPAAGGGDQRCSEVQDLGRLHTPYHVDNDENGASLRLCVPRTQWSQLWPEFRHLG